MITAVEAVSEVLSCLTMLLAGGVTVTVTARALGTRLDLGSGIMMPA